jgi:tRNA(Ile)-lysidine synthase
MSELREQLAETLRPYAGRKFVVAVSGGLDSVALLDLLYDLRTELDLELVVAHVDHGLRRGSPKDAAFVERLAAGLSLPYVSTRLELNPGGNQEARARDARYRWLESVRRRRRADYVVTAHQADDQVETLFLNLTRGAGMTGLSGMELESGQVLRPLLDVTRRQLTSYVRRRKLKYRLDASNRNLKFARNRIRHQVIRSLQRINPQLVETVSQSMRVLDEEQLILQHLAEQELAKVTRPSRGSELVVSVQKLSALPRPMRNLVWREAVRRYHGNLTGFRLIHFENLDHLLALQVGRVIHLPDDLVAKREYDAVVLARTRRTQPPKTERLKVPGSARFGELSVTVSGSRARRTSDGIFVDRQLTGPVLIVRSPKVGDRFKPAGMRGSKSVAKLLSDAKVPRDERAYVPVITTAAGEIIWVAGHRADRRFAARPKKSKLLLRVG